MDIRCYTFVQWCGLSGPDANVEVPSYQSILSIGKYCLKIVSDLP